MTELGTAFAALVFGFSLAGVASPASAKALFPDDCRAGSPANLVLLDVTTRYDDIDRANLTDSLSAILDALEPGQKLRIDTIEDHFSHSRHLIDACVPYCPPMSFLQSIFSSCTEGVLAQKRKQLAAELHRVLAPILAGSTELPRSDIVQTIFYAVGELGAGAPLTLFVFSDMLENSDLFATSVFLAQSPNAMVRRATAAHVVPTMPGATVRVFGIGRSHAAERPDLAPGEMAKLTDLWRAYFAAAGATDVTLLPHLQP